MSPSALRVADAAPLAHCVASARDLGARALSIKGLVADVHGVRRARVAADADVWVRAGEFETALCALEELGWRERETSEAAHDLFPHSVTLIHSDWPCDIDLHRHFPGFLAPDAQVFEELWSRRVELIVAGVEIAAVDRASSILIAALHALRNPTQTPRHQEELQTLVREVLPRLSVEEREDLVSLATRTGAVDTARPLLEHLGVPLPAPVKRGKNAELDAWRERLAAEGSVLTFWSATWRTRPWRERPALLARIIWPSEQDFRLDHPEVAPGNAALLKARFQRFGRGFRSIPGVIRGRRMARKGITDDSLLQGVTPGEPTPDLAALPQPTPTPASAPDNPPEPKPDPIPGALAKTEGLAHVDHDDYTVVLNLPRLQEQQSPYIFDGSSFAIWNLIDGTRTEQQIVEELAEAYDTPDDQIAPDVAAFVTQLRARDLIGLAGGG